MSTQNASVVKNKNRNNSHSIVISYPFPTILPSDLNKTTAVEYRPQFLLLRQNAPVSLKKEPINSGDRTYIKSHEMLQAYIPFKLNRVLSSSLSISNIKHQSTPDSVSRYVRVRAKLLPLGRVKSMRWLAKLE